MQSPTHTECSTRFFPMKPEPCEVPAVFPFINLFCEGSFFFGQSSKRLSADRLRCEHRRFYMATSVGLVSYILADLGPRGELLTKQPSFLVQPKARLARIASRHFGSLFRLKQSRLQASTKHTYARDTAPFSSGMPPGQEDKVCLQAKRIRYASRPTG